MAAPSTFLVSTQGLAISGSGKSFVHAEHADPDATVIDGDLDAAVDALADKDVLLQRRIDEPGGCSSIGAEAQPG